MRCRKSQKPSSRGRTRNWRQPERADALTVRSNVGAGWGEDMPYRPRRSLLTQGELAFYRVLRDVVGDRYGIAIKPRLADVLLCPAAKWRTRHGARVAQRHVDFVLYDLETAAIALAIELDDRSHERRKRRDAFLDRVLAVTRVKLVRVKAARHYERSELERVIARSVGLTGTEALVTEVRDDGQVRADRSTPGEVA